MKHRSPARWQNKASRGYPNTTSGTQASGFSDNIFFTKLKLYSIQALYNFLQMQAQSRVGISPQDLKTFVINFGELFSKQKYDNSLVAGETLLSNEMFAIYEIRGAGTLNNNRTTITDDEVYLDIFDTANEFNLFPTLYDLFSEVLISTAQAYILADKQIKEYQTPDTVISIDLTQETTSTDISLTYQIVNINTGRVDKSKGVETTTVITAPGSANNINIPSIYNCYPIEPNRATKQAFIPSGNNTPLITNSVGCSAFGLDATSPQTLDAIGYNPNNVNVGNCGFFTPAFEEPNEFSDTNKKRRWLLHDGQTIMPHKTGFPNKLPSARLPDVEMNNGLFIAGMRSRRPVDMLNLNTIENLIYKLFYIDNYSRANDGTSGMQAVVLNEKMAVSAIPSNLNATELTSLTNFDWFQKVVQEGALNGIADGKTLIPNNCLSHDDTVNNFIGKYGAYKDIADKQFDDLFNKKIYDKFMVTKNNLISHIRLTLKLTLTISNFKRIFGVANISELLNNEYELKITNDPAEQAINQIYEVVGIGISGELIELQLLS